MAQWLVPVGNLLSWSMLCAAIGSGGAFAGAAARALRDIDSMDAKAIGEQCVLRSS